jgi:NAD(P)-dependent dehydrogenase (short-subunit alcohol dehydrogenase family)
MKLEGAKAIVTGATQGLGRVIAEEFLRAGAVVTFCGRSSGAVSDVESSLGSIGKIRGFVCDLADKESSVKFVKDAVGWMGGVDVLVNNAGLLGPIGPAAEVDWEAWEETVAVNLFSTVRLCRSVVPLMAGVGRGKIINLSGGGATSPMPGFSAYAASKAAVVRFTETLAVELAGSGIEVNAVAPGLLKTRMMEQMLEAGPDRAGRQQIETVRKSAEAGGTPPELAARLCVFLASPLSDGITGKLISAPWDPWEDLPNHLGDLKNSDIYTLRRITPSDRGKTWDPKAGL